MAKKKLSAKEKVSSIKAIYLFAAVATGIVILIFGTYLGIRTLLNIMFLDEYPVRGEAYICAEISSEEQQIDYERCLENIDSQRKKELVSDVAGTISSLIVGPAILIPHGLWTKDLLKERKKK